MFLLRLLAEKSHHLARIVIIVKIGASLLVEISIWLAFFSVGFSGEGWRFLVVEGGGKLEVEGKKKAILVFLGFLGFLCFLRFYAFLFSLLSFLFSLFMKSVDSTSSGLAWSKPFWSSLDEIGLVLL